MPRWPGWDGTVLVALDLLAVGLWWLKGLDGMGIPVLTLCLLTAGWLALTRWVRRPT